MPLSSLKNRILDNRILSNFGVVLRGRGIAALFSVAATALMASALPAAEFGIVVLLHTYIMVVRGFLNFRTFEAIVRFGVPLHDAGDEKGLNGLLRSTLLIDFGACSVATLIGVAAAPVAAYLLNWSAEVTIWAVLYSLAMLSTPINTSNGILRLYDRFDALSVQFAVGPSIRLILVISAWIMEADMGWFVAAWAVAFVAGNAYLFVRGHIELGRHNRTPLWQEFEWRRPVQDLRARSREFWHFVLVVYWQTNVDLLPKHLSTMIAGALLGPAAAGMFRLAREFSTVLTQPVVILRDVLFPDLTRSWNTDGGRLGNLPYKTAAMAGLIGLCFVVLSVFISEGLLGLIGEDYVAAAPLLVLMLLAASFDLAGASLRAAAYAMGRAATILRINLLGIFSYVSLFFVLTGWLGLVGPGYAAIAASLLTLILTLWVVSRHR